MAAILFGGKSASSRWTAERRLVKHGYKPGTLIRALKERDRREHADRIVRYMQMYR